MAMDFHTLVNALASTLGLASRTDDFQQVCWKLDEVQLTIEHDPANDMVWLHSPFGTIDESLTLEALQRIFKGQYFLKKTFGCIITREEDGQYKLHYKYPLSRMNHAKFENIVETFTNLVELAKERLQQPELPYPKTTEPSEEQPLDFLVMNCFRV